MVISMNFVNQIKIHIFESKQTHILIVYNLINLFERLETKIFYFKPKIKAK